jgi:DNA recombination-dependent growth factor C
MRAEQLQSLLKHVNSATHVAAVESGRAPETKVVAWIREHGEANKMTVMSSIEATSKRLRLYVVKCGTCSKELRVKDVGVLQRHLDSATHVSALESGQGPGTKINAWIRKHGGANMMTLVSNDEMTASGKRVHVVKCGACRTEIRAHQIKALLSHVNGATHVAALESGRAPESKVDAWIREHGDANKMGFEMVVNAKGARTWNVDCGTCGTKLRGIYGVGSLEAHVKSATHRSAALGSSRATRDRKRPRS